MSARDKLNATHLTGVLIVAGFIGLATNSSSLAILTAVVLMILGVKDGRLRPPSAARPPPRARHRSRRRR